MQGTCIVGNEEVRLTSQSRELWQGGSPGQVEESERSQMASQLIRKGSVLGRADGDEPSAELRDSFPGQFREMLGRPALGQPSGSEIEKQSRSGHIPEHILRPG
jgi:hypothetical protein